MRIVRPKAVAERLGLSLSAVHRLARRDPSFPKPLKISAGRAAAGFLDHELDKWLEQRADDARCKYAAAAMLEPK